MQQPYLTSIQTQKSSLHWVAAVINKLLMTIWSVWGFRNNINKSKNGPEYLQKKQDLGCKINKEYTLGITNLLPKAHHLIYTYLKKNPFQVKFGRQRDWIKQIPLARKEYLSDIKPNTKSQPRTNNSLQVWLIIGTEEILCDSTTFDSSSTAANFVPHVSKRHLKYSCHPQFK